MDSEDDYDVGPWWVNRDSAALDDAVAAKRKFSTTISDELLKLIPKTDLHVHLDGSVRLTTLIDLAQKFNVPLPAYTVEGLKEKVFKDHYTDLPEILQCFGYVVPVLQCREALERVAYELACDNFDEGVRYVEVRFAPQLHCHDGFGAEDVVKSVNDGLLRAKKEYNARPQVQSGEEPYFEYGIILCAMRFFTSEFSQYFKRLAQTHELEHEERLYELASSNLARLAVAMRNEGLPVVALDIAGAEAGYPAKTHKEAYDYAHANFLRKTVHAGEGYGPESIFQAIGDLDADRIGHGTNIFRADMIRRDMPNKELFCHRLANHLAGKNLNVEVCLTSNCQSIPELRGNLEKHPLKEMLACHMAISINTDNRTVSNTTVTKEYIKARDAFDLNPMDIRRLVIAGFKAAFFPGPNNDKHKYVQSIVQYYHRIEQQCYEKEQMLRQSKQPKKK